MFQENKKNIFVGRQFQTRGPAALKALSPKLVRVRLTYECQPSESTWAGVGGEAAVVSQVAGFFLTIRQITDNVLCVPQIVTDSTQHSRLSDVCAISPRRRRQRQPPSRVWLERNEGPGSVSSADQCLDCSRQRIYLASSGAVYTDHKHRRLCCPLATRYCTNTAFPNLFWLLTKIAPRHWVFTPPPIKHLQEYCFTQNAHLFRLHTQLKGNKWKKCKQ